MLDLARVKLPAAFPDHPHRGFERVAYALEGCFSHKDFRGHKGTFNAGGGQLDDRWERDRSFGNSHEPH